ncbi:MAG: hypothetical protein AAB782_00120 [Patescibacteria group bacterium]
MSFIGTGIFGFVIFDHGMDSPNSNCVASAMNITVCPTSIIGMTLHHISALQTLATTAVSSGSNWLLLLATLLLISVSIFLFYKNLLFPKLKFLRWHLRGMILLALSSKQKIISWLSLFELSPAS